MAPESPSPLLGPPSPVGLVRIEYRGFQNIGDHREFGFGILRPEGVTEFRLHIPSAAFGDGRIRLQDGPDVCYQKLLRVVAGVQPVDAEDVIPIDDADLASYREAHTKVARHRKSWTPPVPDPSMPAVSRPAIVRRPSRAPSAVPATVEPDGVPRFEEGQRVSHAAFGPGVMASSRGGHTVVFFDGDGRKTFVTSIVKLEILSPPHTWETGPRGQNRLCAPSSTVPRS